MRLFLKHWLAEPLTAALIALLFGLLSLLPFTWASSVGGYVARKIGPKLAISRKARRNLRFIYPDMGAARRREILRQMWDNLGRNFAEYPLLARKEAERRVTVLGEEHAAAARATGKPVIFLCAHTGNWEVLPHYWARTGWKVHIIYRAANNAAVDRIIQMYRQRTGHVFSAKGKQASKAMIASLSQGGNLALLADQKMGEGENLPFLGKPGLTATGWARLAIKHKALIVPVRVVREKGSLFHIIYEPPLAPQEDEHQLALQVNDVYSRWIAQYPGQWLWLHRRWGKV